MGSGEVSKWGMTGRTKEHSDTASKFITSRVDLLFKSQPFNNCFSNKNNQYMRYRKLCLVKMTTLFYNLSKTDAVMGIGLARGVRGSLFSHTAVINDNIDNQGAWVPSIQILPTSLNV